MRIGYGSYVKRDEPSCCVGVRPWRSEAPVMGERKEVAPRSSYAEGSPLGQCSSAK